MITKEQALGLTHGTELHFGQCQVQIGMRGGVHITQVKARVNGKVKTWKTKPDQFQVPIKHGMYESGYLHDRNADDFHLASDCALVKDHWLKLITSPVIGDAFHDMALLKGLPEYFMDSRNDLQKRAGAVRRMDYVVGAVPPSVPNDELVKQAVVGAFEGTFGSVLAHLLEAYPHLDPKELK